MLNVPNNLVSLLKHQACKALSDAYNEAETNIMANSVSRTQHESLHVAQLCGGIAKLAGDWRVTLAGSMPGIKLSMTSVFTHQSPHVTWSNVNSAPCRCELADLLVTVIDRTGGSSVGYATLIQAKLSTSGSVNFSNSERTQFELLSTLPEFDVVAATSPAQVDLQNYSLDTALLYGLATKQPASHIGLSCSHLSRARWLVKGDLRRSPSTNKITASDCLSSILVGLLEGNVGCQFCLPPLGKDWQHFNAITPRDYWSELINYLLKETFGKFLVPKLHKAAGRPYRGQEDVLYLVSDDPAVGTMLFMTDMTKESQLYDYFGSDEELGSEWRSTNYNQLMNCIRDIGVTDQLKDEIPPESGPISVIVFEIARGN